MKVPKRKKEKEKVDYHMNSSGDDTFGGTNRFQNITFRFAMPGENKNYLRTIDSPESEFIYPLH